MQDRPADSALPHTRANIDPSQPPRPVNAGDQLGGFAKGLAVIEAYGRGRSSLTIAEVAKLSGLDRASAPRCLLTLVNRGYATTDGRYFELTPRVLRLGYAYLAASLPTLIQPTLDSLASTLRESCSASVLDGTEIVYVARAARHRLIGVGLVSGSRRARYCTSMARVLLGGCAFHRRAMGRDRFDVGRGPGAEYFGREAGGHSLDPTCDAAGLHAIAHQ